MGPKDGTSLAGSTVLCVMTGAAEIRTYVMLEHGSADEALGTTTSSSIPHVQLPGMPFQAVLSAEDADEQQNQSIVTHDPACLSC